MKRVLSWFLAGALTVSSLYAPNLAAYAAETGEFQPAAVSEIAAEDGTAAEPDVSAISETAQIGSDAEVVITEENSGSSAGLTAPAESENESTEAAASNEEAAQTTEASTETADEATEEATEDTTESTEASTEAAAEEAQEESDLLATDDEVLDAEEDVTSYTLELRTADGDQYLIDKNGFEYNDNVSYVISGDKIDPSAIKEYVSKEVIRKNNGWLLDVDPIIRVYSDKECKNEITEITPVTSENCVVYVNYTVFLTLTLKLGDQHESELNDKFLYEEDDEDHYAGEYIEGTITEDNLIGSGAAYLDPDALNAITTDWSVEVQGPYTIYDDDDLNASVKGSTDEENKFDKKYFGYVQTVYTLTVEANTGFAVPDPIRKGYSIKNWYNETKAAKITTKEVKVNQNSSFHVVWNVTDGVEVQLGPVDGFAEFNPSAVNSKYYAPASDETSNVKGYTDERIDGYIHVKSGDKIGSAFETERTETKAGGYIGVPIMDPIPAHGHRGVFVGWAVSNKPGKIYSSIELSKLVVDGPMLIRAVWTNTDVNSADGEEAVRLTFHSKDTSGTVPVDQLMDGNLNSVVDATPGTDTTIVKYVAPDTDVSSAFNVTPHYQYAQSTDESLNKKYVFNGWANKNGEDTGWVFTSDTDLYPSWQNSGSYLSSLKLTAKSTKTSAVSEQTGNGYEITVPLNDTVKFTATLGIYGTVFAGETETTWMPIQKIDNNWENLKGNDAAGLISFTTSNVAEEYNGIDIDYAIAHSTESKGKKSGDITPYTVTASFTAKKVGDVRLVVRGKNGKTAIVTVHIRNNKLTKLEVHKDNKKDGEVLKEASVVLQGNVAVSGTGFKSVETELFVSPVPVSGENLYIAMSGSELFDFFKVNEKPVADLDGVNADAKNTKKVITINNTDGTFPFILSTVDGAHAGAATLTLTTDNADIKPVVFKLVVTGYDETTNKYFNKDGSYVKSDFKTFPENGKSVTAYFDDKGIRQENGIITKGAEKFVLVNGVIKKASTTAGNKYEYTYVPSEDASAEEKEKAEKERGTYFINREGVIQYGRKVIDGDACYFDKNNNGKMITESWFTVGSYKYYAGEDGVLASGAKLITNSNGDEYYYYFEPTSETSKTSNVMKTGWISTTLTGSGSKHDYLFSTFYGFAQFGLVYGSDGLYLVTEDAGKVIPKDSEILSNSKYASIKTSPESIAKHTYQADGEDEASTYFLTKTGKVIRSTLITVTDTNGTTTTSDDVKTYYYVGADGKMVTNKNVCVSGQWYYFGNNGESADRRSAQIVGTTDRAIYSSVKKIWQYEDGKTVSSKWITDRGEYYYIVSGKPATGFKTITDANKVKKLYYFAADGCLVNTRNVGSYGIKRDKAGEYTTFAVNGKLYAVNADGEVATATWVNDEYYATATSGVLYTGLKSIKEGKITKTYYFDTMTAKKQTGIKKIGTKIYNLTGENGELVKTTGFVEGVIERADGITENATCYIKTDGTLQTGWATLTVVDEKTGKKVKKTFYFDENGILSKSNNAITTVSGNITTYYATDEDGVRITGWAAVASKTSLGTYEWVYKYYTSTGKAAKAKVSSVPTPDLSTVPDYEPSEGDIVKLNNLLDSKGKITKNTYFFDSKAEWIRGTITPAGRLLKAQFYTGGVWYDINKDGHAMTQEEKIRYTYDGTTGSVYYSTTKGTIKKGLVTDKDGYMYIFNPNNGKQVTSSLYKYSNRWYYVGRDGRVQNSVSAKYQKIGQTSERGAGTATFVMDATKLYITKIYDESGSQLKNAVVTIKGQGGNQSYLIGSTGAIVTGQVSVTVSGVKYTYFCGTDGNLEPYTAASTVNDENPSGTIAKNGSTWFYQTKNSGFVKASSGVKAVYDNKGNTYYVDVNGSVQRSKYVTYNGKKLYIGSDGLAANGWTKVGTVMYLFNDGLGVSGEHRLNEAYQTVTTDTLDYICCTTDTNGKIARPWSVMHKNGVTNASVTGTFFCPTDDGRYKLYYFKSGSFVTGDFKIYNYKTHTYDTKKAKNSVEVDKNGNEVLYDKIPSQYLRNGD